jgi:urea transport system ATP-binding protein
MSAYSVKHQASEAPEPMLSIQDLNVYYGESHILRDVDLNVAPGKMVCLIGRNGVGKTTLLKTIMGLLPQRSGDIYFEGSSLSKMPTDRRVKSGIAYVPQGREIIARLTVEENLLLGMEARAGGRKKSDRIPAEIFDLFPVLQQMLGRMGGDLSGGQQQQLSIARALMGNPRLLVLDEPTEGIQPSIILEIEAAVKKIVQETGISVLLVEQHLHFVRQADWYYAMQKGGIVASGSTDELSKDVVAVIRRSNSASVLTKRLLWAWRYQGLVRSRLRILGVSIELSMFNLALALLSRSILIRWGRYQPSIYTKDSPGLRRAISSIWAESSNMAWPISLRSSAETRR